MCSSFTAQGNLPVEIHPTNAALGRAAAAAVAHTITSLARSQDTIRVIFGSANSQISFITALTTDHSLPWKKLVCFHMDEYIGLPAGHPASFRRWMKERLANVVPLKNLHYLNGDASDVEAEIARYTALLRERPIDLTCLGIGENGHLAFNDPPFADFNDPNAVKRVTLDEKSRRQQVGEAHFPTIDAVPKEALTVTIPMLLSARQVFGIVPERRKAAAVRAALLGPVTESCPASILQRQSHARLYLDVDSASELGESSRPQITMASHNDTASLNPPTPRKLVALDAIVAQGFVPIFVNDTLDSRRLVAAAAEAGCRAIEYTCRRPDARELIPWIKREFPQLLVLGATLMDGPRMENYLSKNRAAFVTVDEMVELGVDALVSFLRFRPETYARYATNHVMVAGVFTPNEALDQIELGADFVKTSVGTAGGLDLVTKTGVPTHHALPFFASGGINVNNVESIIQAGVPVTAAGFDVLLNRDTSLTGAELQTRASSAIRQMLDTVQTAREKHQRPLAEAIRAKTSGLLTHGSWYRANA